MNKTKVFRINGKLKELPLFEKGDRVCLKDNSIMSEKPSGIVDKTSDDGLFVYVTWNSKTYKSNIGGNVELGKMWLVDSIKLL